ncbi:MAG: helix-turn-helix domain-containing protein [Alphaproteobacteria bacterium]|nr:helix-turn-helix domain-containing protein [Alphaproteobacteria bacterium]
MSEQKWKWLRDYMQKHNINQQQVADALQWKKPRISELLSGKRDLPVTKVFLASRFFNLDLEELTKYNTGLSKKIPSAKGNIVLDNKISQIAYIDVIDSANTKGKSLKNTVIDQVPFSAAFAQQLNISETSNLKIIIASGDSMSPTINDRDLVLVNTSINTPQNNGLYLFNIKDELFIKRLSLDKFSGSADIISDNNFYPPIKINNIKKLSCLGKIIFVCKHIA